MSSPNRFLVCCQLPLQTVTTRAVACGRCMRCMHALRLRTHCAHTAHALRCAALRCAALRCAALRVRACVHCMRCACALGSDCTYARVLKLRARVCVPWGCARVRVGFVCVCVHVCVGVVCTCVVLGLRAGMHLDFVHVCLGVACRDKLDDVEQQPVAVLHEHHLVKKIKYDAPTHARALFDRRLYTLQEGFNIQPSLMPATPPHAVATSAHHARPMTKRSSACGRWRPS